MPEQWNALIAEETRDHQTVSIRQLTDDCLPVGDVQVRLSYSSLNYKDGLAVLGRNKVIRQFPMVPGIDFAGTVESSVSPEFSAGDKVLLTGWGVGERHWGGFAQKARVPANWLLRLLPGMTERYAMSVGTAGLTAMLCVMALQENGVSPESGSVLVTGASGGVGSMAVCILAQMGYHVSACTGRPELQDYLKSLGASEILAREALANPTSRPLLPERWAGAIDVAGGQTLTSVLQSTVYGGTVAACGLADNVAFGTTVLPFILRAITLKGIDSVSCPNSRRLTAWNRILSCVSREHTAAMTQVIGLSEVEASSHRILNGQVRGRLVVDVNA